MGAQEAPPELDRQVGRHGGDAEARRVGGDDRGLLHRGGDPGEELALDLEVLDHRLEHPVRVREEALVVLEVAGADRGHLLREVQRPRLQLLQGLDAFSGDGAPVGAPVARSSSRTSSPWPTAWAATWAPMVPAPRTATFLMSVFTNGSPDRHPNRGGPLPHQAAPWYMRSMMSLYFASTTRRLTLMVGVSSPASRVNSRAMRVIFLIFSNWARSGVKSLTSLW